MGVDARWKREIAGPRRRGVAVSHHSSGGGLTGSDPQMRCVVERATTDGQHASRVWVDAPAKLNLSLQVLSRRPDGYHDLESLMVTLDLRDELWFTPAPPGSGLTLRCVNHSPAAAPPQALPPVDDRNLVCRAARLLHAETGCPLDVTIDLFKRIPLEAGLAGGSADAAATLLGLTRLWNLPLSAEQLRQLGGRLGSDIPFFLAQSPAAVCTGRGEVVEPVSLPAGLAFVVAKPSSGLATPRVFQHCRPEPGVTRAWELVGALQAGRLARAGGLLVNTLQPAAELLNEDVRRLRRVFAALPFVGHQMSGSGTSYFGLCRNLTQARTLAARVAAAGRDRVCVARLAG